METKSAVVNEIASLHTQGQGVQSLLYPVGVLKPGAPGIVTMVLPVKDSPRGEPTRYFAEAKLSPFVRLLALLELVPTENVVQGIESQAVMMEMMPDAERQQVCADAQARLTELKMLTELLNTAGSAVYEVRIQAEVDAWVRLLKAALEPYTPEEALSEEAAMLQAEESVDRLRGIAQATDLSEPATDAVDQLIAEIPTRKGT